MFGRVALTSELGRTRVCGRGPEHLLGRGQSPPRRLSPNEPEIVSRRAVGDVPRAIVDGAPGAPRKSFLDRALDDLFRRTPPEPGELNQVFGNLDAQLQREGLPEDRHRAWTVLEVDSKVNGSDAAPMLDALFPRPHRGRGNFGEQ